MSYQVNLSVSCTTHLVRAQQVPESGFTMRATIDTQHQEIHMMSGLSKDHRNGSKDYTDAKTKIYVYSLKRNKWNEVGGCVMILIRCIV